MYDRMNFIINWKRRMNMERLTIIYSDVELPLDYQEGEINKK